MDWVKSFTALLEELRKYVAEYHTAGLAWNPKVGLFPSPTFELCEIDLMSHY